MNLEGMVIKAAKMKGTPIGEKLNGRQLGGNTQGYARM